MAGNPRIDDLRKRIEKDPGSRLFAQLAEELRKDGELAEAIQVARAGLKQHSNYPSARMTLGRALLDTGDWAAAKGEFESVLAGAPDNILASRFIAECLENLGDREGALARYKATLAMAPGEKHVMARIQELEKGGVKAAALPPAGGLRAPTTGAFARPSAIPPASSAVVRPAAPRPAPAQATPPAPASRPPAPVPPPLPPLVQEVPETEPAPEPPPAVPAAQEFAPIPLVDADEEFELERPFESPATGVGTASAPPPSAAPPAAAKPAAAPPAPPPQPPAAAAPIPLSPVEDAEFELESPYEAPATAWKPAIPPLPPPEPEPPPPPPPAAPPPAAAAPAAERESPPARESEPQLLSPTLGELYFNQGFTDKAVEVYRALAAREPGNERLAARLKELEALQRTLGGPPPAAVPPAVLPSTPSEPAPPPPVPPAPVTARPPEPAPPPPHPAPDAAGERREAIERTIGRLEGLLAAIRKG